MPHSGKGDYRKGDSLPGTNQPTTKRDRRRLNAVVSANRRGLIGEAKKIQIKRFVGASQLADKAAGKAARRRKISRIRIPKRPSRKITRPEAPKKALKRGKKIRIRKIKKRIRVRKRIRKGPRPELPRIP